MEAGLGLVRLTRQWVQGRSRRPWAELKGLRPRQNPEVVAAPLETGLELLAHEPRSGFWERLGRRVGKPAQRRFELDRVGAFLWERMDGKRTVGELARAIEGEFKLHRAEVETALTHYLELLHARGLIEIDPPKESRPPASKKAKR